MSVFAAAAVALVAWVALGLQFTLSVVNPAIDGGLIIANAVTFFSFFTVLMNLLVALTLTVPLVSPRAPAGIWSAGPGVRSAIVTYTTIGGLIHSVVLRTLWSPMGAQLVADRLLHDVLPVLYFIFWLWCVEKGQITWRNVPAWLAFPLGYLAYSLLRGAIVDWYPYPFIDAAAIGYPQVVVNSCSIMVGFVLVALLIVWIDRLLAGRSRVPVG